jgi:Flp pilus assembly pilin Flp
MLAKLLRKFSSDEAGATAIEYAVMALIMGIGIIPVVSKLPATLNVFLSSVLTGFNN